MVLGDTAHVANSGNTLTQVYLEVSRVELVNVHVPESWDQERACTVEHRRIGRNGNFAGVSDLDDPAVPHDNGLVRALIHA